MAEKAVVAFGRYLKLLRERRKLSLDDVVALTKAYPEPINKGYLSRAERGLSHIAFSKIVALGRAYEVPVDVFGEKLSLDLEVEQLKDPPVTEGKSIEKSLDEAFRFAGRGLRVQAYVVRRDLMIRAATDDVAPRFESRAQQIAVLTLGHGVAAGLLSRFRLSLHETAVSLDTGALGKKHAPGALIQLSVMHRRLGDIARSRVLADDAIEQARESDIRKLLADAHFARALVAAQESDHGRAIELYREAYAIYKSESLHSECARAMSNLANAYFEAGRVRAAQRALAAAERLAHRHAVDGIKSRTRVLRGMIEASRGNVRKAVSMWLEGLEIAKRAHDRDIAFAAEFQLFKNALRSENTVAALAFGRRLNRLWPWVASDDPDVAEFRELWKRHRPSRRRPVATSQLDGSGSSNPHSSD